MGCRGEFTVLASVENPDRSSGRRARRPNYGRRSWFVRHGWPSSDCGNNMGSGRRQNTEPQWRRWGLEVDLPHRAVCTIAMSRLTTSESTSPESPTCLCHDLTRPNRIGGTPGPDLAGAYTATKIRRVEFAQRHSPKLPGLHGNT